MNITAVHDRSWYIGILSFKDYSRSWQIMNDHEKTRTFQLPDAANFIWRIKAQLHIALIFAYTKFLFSFLYSWSNQKLFEFIYNCVNYFLKFSQRLLMSDPMMFFFLIKSSSYMIHYGELIDRALLFKLITHPLKMEQSNKMFNLL